VSGMIGTMAEPGLRERKKLRTRRAIQSAMLELVSRQGYDATTVEQVAAAAEVSPSTFFRYFPTKEDAIIEDEYDPMMARAIEAQPSELAPVDAVREAILAAGGAIFEDDRERILQRARLSLQVPALRARASDNMRATEQLIATAIAARVGRDPGEFDIAVLASTITAALTTAVFRWAESNGEGDLAALVDEALRVVRDGIR
jgi:AcrR family transcriptional regulator